MGRLGVVWKVSITFKKIARHFIEALLPVHIPLLLMQKLLHLTTKLRLQVRSKTDILPRIAACFCLSEE